MTNSHHTSLDVKKVGEDLSIEGYDDLHIRLDKGADGAVKIRLSAYADGFEAIGSGITIPEKARDEVAEYLQRD